MSFQDKVVDYAVGQVRGRFVPSDEERAAAFELLVELLSRSTTQPLAGGQGSLRDMLSSLHELFDVTRSALRSHGPGTARGTSGNVSFAVIALRVLNEELRPTLTRWHYELLQHEARHPEGTEQLSTWEWERRWALEVDCRAALAVTRRKVVEYVDTLGQIAGAQSLAAAVIAGPASQIFTPHRLEPAVVRPPDFTPREHMVRWLAPVEMFRTVRAQRRATPDLAAFAAIETESITEPTWKFDPNRDGAFWFDYLADTGDAFDGVAPVAWLVGRKRISIPPDSTRGLPIPPPFLPRGRLLVIGGDAVYPYASESGYRNQTELPFYMCFERSAQRDDVTLPNASKAEPIVVAIPGNHDWFGGIEHFEQTFTTRRTDRFADAWNVVQHRRWWHIRLPHGWWLWGIDTGLDNTIPPGQIEYFRQAACELRSGDRVILCSPVPLWQLLQKHPKQYRKLREALVPLIHDREATMSLCLSGDSHYFAHFERRDGIKEDHITAGGGGAFLQPTHTVPQRIPTEIGKAEFTNTARWPLPADSRRMAPKTLPVADKQTGVVVVAAAGLHALFALLVAWRWWQLPWSSNDAGLRDVVRWNLASPWALLSMVVVMGAGVLAVTATSREPNLRRAARGDGFLLGLCIAVTLLAAAVARRLAHWTPWIEVVAGSVVGGVVSTGVFFGLLTWINSRIRAAETITYSRAHSTRYKHFLRFRIDADGDLTCFAIGIDPVGKGWFKALTEYASVPPDDPAGSARIHYIWGKTYPHPVRSLRVAVSISDPQGIDARSRESVFVAVCTALIEAGHTLLYGGRPADGYTSLLARAEAERYANTPTARAHLVNYVANYIWRGPPDAVGDFDGLMRSVRVMREPLAGEDVVQREIRDLTAMRQQMRKDSDVRVVIGGDLRPSEKRTRLAPGVVQEAYLSLRAGQPLLIAGGFDGAGKLLADRILQRQRDDIDDLADHFAPADPETWPVGFKDMVDAFEPDADLHNRLDKTNRELLLTSTDPTVVAQLIARSVDVIARSSPG